MYSATVQLASRAWRQDRANGWARLQAGKIYR